MSQVFTKKSITAGMAQQVVDATTDKAQELGIAVCVAVVDESGHLKAFRSMDNAMLLSIEGAQRKANSALMGMPTQAFADMIKGDPTTVVALQSLPGVLLMGGGMPIVVDGAIVGAIGASGGLVDQDIACAQAGVDSVTN